MSGSDQTDKVTNAAMPRARRTGLLTRIRKLPILYSCGAVIIFASWLSDNYFKAEYVAKRAQHDQVQAHVQSQESLSAFWYSQYLSEFVKTPRNDEYLRNAASLFVLHRASLLALVSTRLMDAQSNQAAELAKRDLLIEKAQQLRKSKDTDGLISVVNSIVNIENTRGNEYLSAFNILYSRMAESEDRWRKVFLVSYIVGAGLMGLAFVLDKSQQSSAESR